MKTPWLVVAFLATCTLGCMAELDGTSAPLDEEDVSSVAAESIIGPTCMGFKPRAAGYQTMSLLSDGITRKYLLYVPAGYDPAQAHPLVLNLHGTGSNAAQQMALSELAPLADAHGYVIAAPQALGGTWNVPVDPSRPSDVWFMHMLIDQVSEYLCIDQTRVYATGFSGGARMVSLLGCDMPHRLAAIAPVGGLRFPAPCTGTLSVISFHGTSDAINPYDGGGSSYWQDSVPDACMGWATHSACNTSVSWAPTSPSVSRLWYECPWNRENVALYRVTGMGHQWPGSSVDTGYGAQTQEISASQLMMSFFATHSRPLGEPVYY